jgi:hypothetical protein
LAFLAQRPAASREITGQKPSVSAILMINFPPINTRVRARVAQVSARGPKIPTPPAASGLTDLLLKSKNYSRKLSG